MSSYRVLARDASCVFEPANFEAGRAVLESPTVPAQGRCFTRRKTRSKSGKPLKAG